MARKTRFTVFDKMEADGVFDANPANAQARSSQGEQLYKGPVAYPKMLYHPDGETEVVREGSLEPTTKGVMLIDQHSALIHRVVATPKEEKELRAKGWHDHPADAIAAAGGDAPEKGAGSALQTAQQRTAQLEAELAALRKQVKEGTPA